MRLFTQKFATKMYWVLSVNGNLIILITITISVSYWTSDLKDIQEKGTAVSTHKCQFTWTPNKKEIGLEIQKEDMQDDKKSQRS